MLRYDFLALAGAIRCRLLGISDGGRWQNAAAFTWDERTKLIAAKIPVGARVIEFGAGKRSLEKQLHPTCAYFPSDLLDRGSDTILLDLNVRPLPVLSAQNLDVAVFAGVLEYIRDLPSLLPWLVRHTPCVIASYECAKSRRGTWKRLSEEWSRAKAGWVNSYSEAELIQMFADVGLPLNDFVDWHTPEGVERIFKFG